MPIASRLPLSEQQRRGLQDLRNRTRDVTARSNKHVSLSVDDNVNRLSQLFKGRHLLPLRLALSAASLPLYLLVPLLAPLLEPPAGSPAASSPSSAGGGRCGGRSAESSSATSADRSHMRSLFTRIVTSSLPLEPRRSCEVPKTCF